MRAYLIDPFAQTVTEVDYTGPYTQIYTFIECGTFACVSINEDLDADTIYVDDEGLLGDLAEQAFFTLDTYPQPLAGKGLVLGCDDEGDTAAAKIELDALRQRIQFYGGKGIVPLGDGRVAVYLREAS